MSALRMTNMNFSTTFSGSSLPCARIAGIGVELNRFALVVITGWHTDTTEL